MARMIAAEAMTNFSILKEIKVVADQKVEEKLLKNPINAKIQWISRIITQLTGFHFNPTINQSR